MTTLEKQGQRLYFRGAPFAVKDVLKAGGCHWDPDAKAWWIGATKQAEADAMLARIMARENESAAKVADLPAASGDMVEVPGNTYPVREQLRAMGGTWDGAAKVWRVPASRLEAAKALVTGAPKSTFRHTKCTQCGARPNARGWPRIYRNGICSDCYRDEREEAEMGY